MPFQPRWLPEGIGEGATRLALSACPDEGDLDGLGVNHVIALIEAWEFERLEPPTTLEARRRALASRGVSLTHDPIEDLQAPTLAQARRLAALIRAALRRDQRVLVHCMAGLGRAGTIVACVLVSYGMRAEGAIAMTRWIRPGAIQSYDQERLIEAFATSMRGEALI